MSDPYQYQGWDLSPENGFALSQPRSQYDSGWGAPVGAGVGTPALPSRRRRGAALAPYPLNQLPDPLQPAMFLPGVGSLAPGDIEQIAAAVARLKTSGAHGRKRRAGPLVDDGEDTELRISQENVALLDEHDSTQTSMRKHIHAIIGHEKGKTEIADVSGPKVGRPGQYLVPNFNADVRDGANVCIMERAADFTLENVQAPNYGIAATHLHRWTNIHVMRDIARAVWATLKRDVLSAPPISFSLVKTELGNEDWMAEEWSCEEWRGRMFEAGKLSLEEKDDANLRVFELRRPSLGQFFESQKDLLTRRPVKRLRAGAAHPEIRRIDLGRTYLTLLPYSLNPYDFMLDEDWVQTSLPNAGKWTRVDYFPFGLTERFARELAGMPRIEEGEAELE